MVAVLSDVCGVELVGIADVAAAVVVLFNENPVVFVVAILPRLNPVVVEDEVAPGNVKVPSDDVVVVDVAPKVNVEVEGGVVVVIARLNPVVDGGIVEAAVTELPAVPPKVVPLVGFDVANDGAAVDAGVDSNPKAIVGGVDFVAALPRLKPLDAGVDVNGTAPKLKLGVAVLVVVAPNVKPVVVEDGFIFPNDNVDAGVAVLVVVGDAKLIGIRFNVPNPVIGVLVVIPKFNPVAEVVVALLPNVIPVAVV